MTALTERLDVEAITAEAREVKFGRTLLTLIAAVFFGIGWLVAKAWLSVAWCAVAVKVGFQEGRGKVQQQPRPSSVG